MMFIYLYCCAGSGKSILGAHLAYTFAKLNQSSQKKEQSTTRKCVVYCGSSNVSVDVVASTYVIVYCNLFIAVLCFQ